MSATNLSCIVLAVLLGGTMRFIRPVAIVVAIMLTVPACLELSSSNGTGGGGGSEWTGAITASSSSSSSSSSGGQGGVGGAGSTSSSSSSSGAPTCDDVSMTCNACSQCSINTGKCSDEYDACLASMPCSQYTACILGCGSNQVCVDNCDLAHPQGAAQYAVMATCVICTDCFNKCNGASFMCP